MGKTARYREKPCKYSECGNTHRNQGVYCSNSCRNKDRKGKYTEEWKENIGASMKKLRLENPDENIMYALLNNLKRQKNPTHQPEDDLFIGDYSSGDNEQYYQEDGDVWSPC